MIEISTINLPRRLTDSVDTATSDDSPLATDDVGNVTSDDRTKESTSRENRSDQREPATSKLLGARAFDQLDENRGGSDTVDVAGVVAEEDTTERGEGAHEVGLPGNGSLDALDIGGGRQAANGGGRGGGDLAFLLSHG